MALYCRVSTTLQLNDRQEEDLLAYVERSNAEKPKFEVIKIFRETASGSKDDRPFRKEIILMARQKYISAILVTEINRWSRGTLDLIKTLNELKNYDVSLIALNGMNFDLDTPQGNLMLTQIAGLGEFEKDVIRERVRSGIASAKAKGVVFGRKKGNHYKTDRISSYLINDIQQGVYYKDIVKKYDISIASLYNIKKRFGIDSNKCHYKTDKIAIDVCKDGINQIPYREIAKKYRISIGSVANIIKRHATAIEEGVFDNV